MRTNGWLLDTLWWVYFLFCIFCWCLSFLLYCFFFSSNNTKLFFRILTFYPSQNYPWSWSSALVFLIQQFVVAVFFCFRSNFDIIIDFHFIRYNIVVIQWETTRLLSQPTDSDERTHTKNKNENHLNHTSLTEITFESGRNGCGFRMKCLCGWTAQRTQNIWRLIVYLVHIFRFTFNRLRSRPVLI